MQLEFTSLKSMQQLKSLSDIFEKTLFRIPDYQRGYAWREKQLIEFWEDIMTLNNERLHYTGVLSLNKVDNEIWKNWNDEEWLISKRKFIPYFVVDGQQRLTTSVIFIQSLIELIKSFPTNKGKTDTDIFLGTYTLNEIIERYIVVCQPPNNIIKSYKFGYEKDNPSFEFLRHKVFNEPAAGIIEETFYTLNLEEAKLFFCENLKAYVKEKGEDAIEDIFEKLTQRLMFNVYEIDKHFDVFVAFETMNNRGKQLSDLELLKNRLIYLTTLYSTNEVKENEKIKVRDLINSAWKEVYYHLGKNKHSPLNDNDFLRAHWIMYFKYSRQKGNDYIRFLLDEQFNPKTVLEKIIVNNSNICEVNEIYDENELDEEEKKEEEIAIECAKLNINDISQYVLSLKDASKYWYISHFPITEEITKEESVWLDKLNRIGISYFRPLILSSFVNKACTEKHRVELFKAIERFIFLVFRINKTSSSWRSSDYLRAAKSLYWDEININDVINWLNNDLYWLFDENTSSFNYIGFYELMSKKFKSEGSGFYGWNAIRYFLYEYEESLIPNNRSHKIHWNDFKNYGDLISIEHILPLTDDNEYWKKMFKSESKKQKEYCKGSLGNLLSLSISINSSLQNSSFPNKKKILKNEKGKTIRNGYENGSYSEQQVARYDNWDYSTIKERGLMLLEFMEKRWGIKFESEDIKLKLLHLDIK
ncbi:MAG: hypothetical protein H6Q15_478 [Bacteroidetes bacterium]|nr:hypothetical protein [Bacteroidota bacterium]